MTSGKPDWSEQEQVIDYLGSSDLNELAVRSGGYQRYFRGGNVIFQTGFNDTDDFMKLTNGGGTNLLGVANNAALINHQSIRSVTRPGAGSNFIDKSIPYVFSSYLSLIGGIALEDATTLVTFKFNLFDGTNVNFATLVFDQPNDRIYIVGKTVGAVKLRDFVIVTSGRDRHWTIFKLTIDLINNKYFTFDISGTQYDISAYELQSAASGQDGQTLLTIEHIVPGADQSTIFLDALAITVNDPL